MGVKETSGLENLGSWGLDVQREIVLRLGKLALIGEWSGKCAGGCIQDLNGGDSTP